MTATERRIRQLERQVAELKDSMDERLPSYSDIAKERCRDYWEEVRGCYRGELPFNQCIEIARTAFKDKRNCCFLRKRPQEYIATYTDACEFVELFKGFMDEYLKYLNKGGCDRW